MDISGKTLTLPEDALVEVFWRSVVESDHDRWKIEPLSLVYFMLL